jgi:formylglycine-generating enzyme required for sulfatase activity
VSAHAQEVVRDSIPGSLVEFELVHVPAGRTSLPLVGGGSGDRWVSAYLIGRTEVSWNAYDAFTLSRRPSPRYSPSGADAVAGPSRPYGNPDHGFGHAGFPVVSVTRGAAEAFCAWLSQVTGKRYRLPTEAEWQRAADVAGKERDLGALAWHAANAGQRTHALATREPDALGLFDLFGNAAEWVTTDDGTLVVRGGSFRDSLAAAGPLARHRQTDAWNERDPQIPKSSWWLSDAPFVGFRVVRDP